MTTQPKLCAAKIGPHECNNARQDGKLFCHKHQHASNRIYLARHWISHEALAQMMQRDGETQ